MLGELKELWKFRELLFSLVERDLRIRYKNSFLGFFWSLLNPLITVWVMTVVFQNFFNDQTPNLSAYILAAYLPFMSFQLCVMDSAQSVIVAMPLIKKIYFPREILPLASVVSNFVHLLLALAVFFTYLIVWVWLRDPRIFPIPGTIVFLPVLLLIQFALSAGIALIVSALNTFYEDIKYIVSVGLYLLFFVSPIMYFSETVLNRFKGEPWAYVAYHINPLATLCTSYRKVLLDPQPVGPSQLQPLPLDWSFIGVAAAISLAIVIGGYALFNKMKWRFVERP